MYVKRWSAFLFTLLLGILAACTKPETKEISMILIAFDNMNEWSIMDKVGIEQALDEIGLGYDLLDTSSTDIAPETLQRYTVVILSETELSAAEMAIVADYVSNGGGILVSGKAVKGLETVLGIHSIHPQATKDTTKIRFTRPHPVSYGAYWDGPIMTNPPMPASEIPSISQFVYPDTDFPAYYVENVSGQAIAEWLVEDEAGDAAIVVSSHGQGRTIYSGALPGLYAHPAPGRFFTWRVFITNAIEWLSAAEPLVEIGYWPDAQRAAFVWSGDTETAVMKLAVPPILDLFAQLGLENFGTFYVVGRRGGSSGTEGAREHPDIVEMILEAGSEVGGHGDVHTSFNSGSQAEQAARLQEMIDILNPILAPYGEAVKGFRGPYIDFTDETFPAVAQVGLLYDSSDADVWSETTFPFYNGHIWEAPPSMPMDWFLFEHFDMSDEEAITIYTDKANYVFSRRGMFNFLHHPWVIDRHLGVLETILQHTIDQGDVWLARQDAVMHWWIQRQDVTIESVMQQGDELHITVQNNGAESIEGVTIWVKADDWDTIKANTDGVYLNPAQIIHNGMTFWVVIIPAIPANSVVTVQVEY